MRVSSFYRAFTPFVTSLNRSTTSSRPPFSLLASVSSISGGATNQTSAATMASQEAYDQAQAFGFSDFECWLTTGGDDRSLILKSGANKYHIQPQPINTGDIFRGSCTGNPPTARGYKAAQSLFESNISGLSKSELDDSIRSIYANQQSRIAKFLKLPPGAAVILCPSGSDAEYIPIAIAKALAGKAGDKVSNAQIRNGVTQFNEIGAGTAPAAIGKYFSTHAPLIGKLSDDQTYLKGFEQLEGPVIAARSRDGNVLDAAGEMKTFTEDSMANGLYPIVHGVFGGKTGVRDAVMPPSLGQAASQSLGVVDACQGRFSDAEMQEWMEQDSLVLFTSSKFYQAPPFCGAVLVPPSIAQKLASPETSIPSEMMSPQGLGGFMTDKELPECLSSWASFLAKEDTNNVGLALRWEAGLAGMEATSSLNDGARDLIVKEWAGKVTNMVKEANNIDVFSVQRSIISIRIQKANGDWLNMKEARELYRWMSMDLGGFSDSLPEEKEALSQVAYIGQPVDVSDDFAIVRIALGAESLLSFSEDKEKTLAEDELAVRKLAAIGKNFENLQKSGL